MDLTQHVRPGLPSLRRREVRDHVRALIGEMGPHGVRVATYALMSNHLHLVVVAESRETLATATRHLFGQLARRLNTLWHRRGRVFDDRFASMAAGAGGRRTGRYGAAPCWPRSTG